MAIRPGAWLRCYRPTNLKGVVSSFASPAGLRSRLKSHRPPTGKRLGSRTGSVDPSVASTIDAHLTVGGRHGGNTPSRASGASKPSEGTHRGLGESSQRGRVRAVDSPLAAFGHVSSAGLVSCPASGVRITILPQPLSIRRQGGGRPRGGLCRALRPAIDHQRLHRARLVSHRLPSPRHVTIRPMFGD